MKFSDLPKPPIQRLDLDVELFAGSPPVKVSMRQLLAQQDGEVLSRARAFSRARGVDNPTEDHPLYLLGLTAATLELAVLCADETEAIPFFDGGMEQILGSLDKDRICHLWSIQSAFQDKCAGLEAPLTQTDVITYAQLLAAAEPGDERVFAALKPGLQRRLLRGLAALVVAMGAMLDAKDRAVPTPGGP